MNTIVTEQFKSIPSTSPEKKEATKEISKPNNYNNQWFGLQLSTAQARRHNKLQHPRRPVKNVALKTKDLQERKKNNYSMGIGSKNKLFLTEIFLSVHKTRFLKVLFMFC